jgi:hypothetical protein
MSVSTRPLEPPSAPRAGLKGSAAIVTGTGAASVATAQAFASAGASVALASRDDLSMMRTRPTSATRTRSSGSCG